VRTHIRDRNCHRAKQASERASELLRYALDKASLLFVLALVGHRVELGLGRDQPERPDHRSEFAHIDGVLTIGVKHPERRRSAQMNRKSGHGRAGWEESNPDGMCVVES